MLPPRLGSNETRKLIEITPKNYDQFFPKVYSDLTLPASALVFVGKEPKQEISKLENLRSECERINLSALIDLSKNASGIVEKYGVDTSELKEKLKKHQLLRERYLLNLLKARGYIVEFNEETRIASIQYGDKKLYGSVYSLFDTSPELVYFEHILRGFETQKSPNNYEHVMSFITDEGYSYQVLNSMSGSYVQTEVNPYPSDFDFNELIHINSESVTEGIEIFRNIILKNFEKFKDNPNSIITKFKMGKFRIKDISGNIQEIKMDWAHDEVLEGRKIIIIDGLELEVTFEEIIKGLNSNDLIKFDFITNITGVYKKCEKIVNFKIINQNEEDIFNHIVSFYSPVQEVYFDDPSKFENVHTITDLDVVYKYYFDMLNDFNRYFNCVDESSTCNPLKAAKRIYTLLKIPGLVQKGRDFSNVLFSEFAKKLQISEILKIHLNILDSLFKEEQKEKSFFSRENIIKSLTNFINDLEKYKTNETLYISHYLKIIIFLLRKEKHVEKKKEFLTIIGHLRERLRKLEDENSKNLKIEIETQVDTLDFVKSLNSQIHT